MTISAELADGRTLEFPDGTDPSVIQATVKKMLSGDISAPEKTRQKGFTDYLKQTYSPERIPQTLAAPLEAGAQMVSAAVGSAVGGLFGLGKLATGSSAADATKSIQNVQQAMTYQPRIQEGKTLSEGVNLPMEKATEGWGMIGGGLGEAVGGAKGKAAGEEIGKTGFQAAALLAGKPWERPADAVKTVAENTRTPIIENANLVREMGLKVAPQELSGGKSGIFGHPLRSITEEGPLKANASIYNAPKVDNFIKQDLGLPLDKPLSKAAIKAKITEKGQIYETIKNMEGEFKVDEGYSDKLHGIVGDYTDTARNFPESMGYPKADTMIGELEVKSFTPKQAIELVKRLRERSSNALNAATVNLDNAEMGAVFRKAADTIEDVIAKNLDKRGESAAYKQFTENRQGIAKAYDMLGALDEATGSFNAQAIGKLYEKDVPLSGKVKDVGRVASAFKDYFQPLKSAAGKTAGTHMTAWGVASEAMGAQPLARHVLLNPNLRWRGVGDNPDLANSKFLGKTLPPAAIVGGGLRREDQ